VGTGWNRNDVYGAYLALGRPPGEGGHLSEDLLAKLRGASSGEAEALPEIVVGRDGKAAIQLPMRSNDVWLVSLERKK
jgi:xylan 1,4-beta-xylosidase